MADLQSSGTQIVTADAAIVSSGVPVRILTIHIVSTGGGAAVVSLKNGTSASATNYITETGTVSTGKTISYGDKGYNFPAGCFVDIDANTASVAVAYSV